MTNPILLSVGLAFVTLAVSANPIVFETATFRYVISTNASNLAFVDRATGNDDLQTTSPSTCALVRWQGATRPATVSIEAVSGRTP